MKATAQTITINNTDCFSSSAQTFKQQIIKGLQSEQKYLPMKYAFDEIGGKLFVELQRVSQYPIFKTELQLLTQHSQRILETIGCECFNVIDLGAGDGLKTQVFLKSAIKKQCRFKYIPIDIDAKSNERLSSRLNSTYPQLQIKAVTAEFEQGIEWVQKNNTQKNVYFFLGSTVGNWPDEQFIKFCKMLQQMLKKSDVFISTFDLFRDPEAILAMYKHKLGAAMIQNILVRINRQLQGTFDIPNFYTYIHFNPYTRRACGDLISKKNQQVKIAGEIIQFKQAEVIEVFMSKKFIISQILDKFQNCSFRSLDNFTFNSSIMFVFQKN